MANSSGLLRLVALVFLCMLVNSPRGGAITCDNVNTDLLPCLGYISGGGSVPSGCCSGMKTLLSSATTKADRQTACSCLKSLATSASDAELQRAASLPATCGVNIPFKISRNIDCSKLMNPPG